MSKSIKIVCIIAGVCVLAIALMLSGLAIQKNLEKRAVEIEDEKAIADEPETITETFTDKEGNEHMVELEKQVFTDTETGEKVLAYIDPVMPKEIYSRFYEGMIEKIEDNKIYFLVDKEDKTGSGFNFEDVEDYRVVFDINTFDFSFENDSHYFSDSIKFNSNSFKSAKELEFLIGKRLTVQDSVFEDNYTKDTSRMLFFQ